MGEILMKKFFDKNNFFLSDFDRKQRVQSLVISIAVIVFFFLSAFTFFNAFYGFVDCIGSIVSGSPDAAIRDITRSIPLILTVFMSIWALLLAHALFRNVDDERRAKSLKKNAFALIGFAAANLLAIIVMMAMGKIHSLVEGAPTVLYPLDTILYSLIFVAIAVFALLYPKKFQEKLPYVVPNRGQIVKKARGLYCTFMSFWMLIAIFSFAAFFEGLFIVDFLHGYLFYSIAVLLVFFVNALFIAVWEFYYNELKDEKKNEFLLPLAIAALAVSVLVAVLYIVGLGTCLDGPSNVGFGILPVAFAASVNMATLLVVFTPVIVSIVALIKGLLARKK